MHPNYATGSIVRLIPAVKQHDPPPADFFPLQRHILHIRDQRNSRPVRLETRKMFACS
jgi:hypothetical protein